MIPQIIHYCWFGGKEKPDSVIKCMESWTKYCPDYDIKEWNESNFDIHENDYCREAYEAKKWAFVADMARLVVLEKYGGIYMDTDVEAVMPFDNLLTYGAFMCFEKRDSVSIGTLGVEKGNPIIADFLTPDNNRHFVREDGSYDLTTNLKFITPVLTGKYHLVLNGQKQVLPHDVLVLPMESFIAKDGMTGWIMADESTYAIHHYAASWYDGDTRRYGELHRKYARLYMKKIEGIIGKAASISATKEFYGYGGVIMKIKDYVLKKSGEVDRLFLPLFYFHIGEHYEAAAFLPWEAAV